MVEYALILASMAGNTLQTLGMAAQTWAARVPWSAVTYALVVLVVIRVVLWAFRPRDH